MKFHTLRHTVETRLVKNNVPIPVVKEITTHSDIRTTMAYVHIDSMDIINAINSLSGE